MSEITTAIAARQVQITQLQSEIGTLERAASVLRGGRSAPEKATAGQPKPKQKRRKRRAAAKATPAQPKQRKQRKPWSAAAKRAMSKRIKASWAARKTKT